MHFGKERVGRQTAEHDAERGDGGGARTGCVMEAVHETEDLDEGGYRRLNWEL